MILLIFVLSLMIFIKTLSYGIFEIKNRNKFGGSVVIIVSVISLFFPNIMVYIKGI